MSRSGPVAIEDARIVTPTGTERGNLVIDDGEIATVEPGPVSCSESIDAEGHLLLPGLVDLHGDEFERYLVPREGCEVGHAPALIACDRANLAAGITTKFHAVPFEEAPRNDRTVARAREVTEALSDRDDLLADNRVHARCEIRSDPAVDAVTDVLADGHADFVSLMEHVPGEGQFDDEAGFLGRYAGDGGTGEARQIARRRQGVDPVALADRIDRVIDAAREAGVPVASHDEEDPTTVRALAERGIDGCEYPVTLEAAREASRHGLWVAMGAPNLLRGESLYDNLAAADARAAGALDFLCSDYRPESLLLAALDGTDEPLHERVARVTRAPAEAAGLDDRGRLVEGARADCILVDATGTPTVRRAFVAGREVYRAQP